MKAVEVKKLAEQFGVQPSKQNGQNFLINDDVVDKIVAGAQVQPGDTIIEIGPGFGALTAALQSAGAKIIAIEKDPKLAKYLQEKFPNITLYNEDALEFSDFPDAPYKIVANLPYSITSPLIEYFIERAAPRPTSATMMMQKEVADRMSTRAPKMQQLALTISMLGSIKKVTNVSPHNFWPQPEVHSAVVRIDIAPKYDDEMILNIQKIARLAYAHKRKQLQKSLSTAEGFDKKEILEALKKAGLDPQIRPEQLTVENWHDFVVYLGH